MTAIQPRRWWTSTAGAFLALPLAVAALVTATAGPDRTAPGETSADMLNARGTNGPLSVS